MNNLLNCTIAAMLAFTAATCVASHSVSPYRGPYDLTCDSLVSPLGDDNATPRFSWKLRDPRQGARQSAYEILVARQPERLMQGKADVWDSGRVASGASIALTYGGAPLLPMTRYYWRVLAWDATGGAYAGSDPAWWETGLLKTPWESKWIGFEDAERRALRRAAPTWVTNPEVPGHVSKGNTRHDFRVVLDIPAGVRRAFVYATGAETASVWINSQRVLDARPLPAWGIFPWKRYEQSEVTEKLRPGTNTLAVEVVHYQNGNKTQSPMNAALVVQMTDGQIKIFKTGDAGWRARLDADGEWYNANFDDGAWQDVIPFVEARDSDEAPAELGIPLRTSPVAALRRAFFLSKNIQSARLLITALGAYKASVNGHPVSDQVLAPGWTDFRQEVAYQDFDVSHLLKPGENVVGSLLAPGWYATPLEWQNQGNNYGATQPALRAELRIRFEDGSTQTITTDESWYGEESPIQSSEIYDGEIFDARRIDPGWDDPGLDQRLWPSAQIVQPHEPEIIWQSWQPIRALTEVDAKQISAPSAGTYIVDFGQILSGEEKIRVHGAAGTDVRMRFGEILNHDGTLYVANLRNAKATDHFILAGTGDESYQPSFTFHGFRYMEISGLAYRPTLADFKAEVLHTAAPETMAMHSGSGLVNQLWSNIMWGQRSNFVGLPTDCPQRDERLGWSADAQVFWRTASFNMDLAAFSRKYAADLRSTQTGTAMFGIYAPGTSKPNKGFGPGWSDAGIIVPWTSWIQTGDLEIVRENWAAMNKYLAAIELANPDGLWINEGGIAFGDWLSPEGTTSQELIATAYWAYDTSLMEQMAHAVGDSESEDHYRHLFEKIKVAFDERFLKKDGVISFGDTDRSGKITGQLETQTGYVLALQMRLVPEELRTRAAQHLVDRIVASAGHLQTGFLGTPYLLEVLSDTSHADVAYRLLFTRSYPSWGYMIDNGATTMWERWNGNQMVEDPGMNSFNHYAYGAVAEWIYRYAAGIDTAPLEAGFQKIRLHPNFASTLGSLDLMYESPYGKIRSAWTMRSWGVEWKITIPPNASAELPVAQSSMDRYSVNGRSLAKSTFARIEDSTKGELDYSLPSGTYSIHITKER